MAGIRKHYFLQPKGKALVWLTCLEEDQKVCVKTGLSANLSIQVTEPVSVKETGTTWAVKVFFS